MREKRMLEEVQVMYKPKFQIEDLEVLSSSRDVERVLRSIWEDDIYYRERMYMLLLNGANKLIGYNLLSIGGHMGTICEVKFAVQCALLTNAKSVILSHNHPSGTNKPSTADVNLTKRLKEALELFDISLLDHVILMPTLGNYYSMAEQGDM